MDEHTQIIHDFNTQMSADSRVESLYLPMRDGLAIFRKNNMQIQSLAVQL